MSERRTTRAPAETEALGAALAARLTPGSVVLLEGEMGTGKTTLVRGACRALGVTGPVTSPTFTLGRRYAGDLPVAHLDLHRLDSLAGEDPGLLADYVTPDGVTFVEWPEAAAGELEVGAAAVVRVRLGHAGGDARTIEVRGVRVLGWDTATPATAVALLDTDTGAAAEERDDPPPGARPGHAARLLVLAEAVLAAAGIDWGGVDRLAVGVGPGSFTGLRIGLATARGAALARGLPLVGVSTLRALAAGAGSTPVLAVLDARRGEAFAAAWGTGGAELLAPAALGPAALAERLAGLPAGLPAVGDGAVAFRPHLTAAGAVVPEDASPLHRVAAAWICRVGAAAEPEDPATVLPHYIRPPDARPRRREVP